MLKAIAGPDARGISLGLGRDAFAGGGRCRALPPIGYEFKEIQSHTRRAAIISAAGQRDSRLSCAVRRRAYGRDSPRHGRPGWVGFPCGTGQGDDTDRFFVVCPMFWAVAPEQPAVRPPIQKPGVPYSTDFPPVTIRDMVRAQAALLDHLQLPEIFASPAVRWRNAGAGLGDGLSDRVRNCMPVATCTAHHAMQIAFNENRAGRRFSPTPNWRDGIITTTRTAPGPRTGWAVARMSAT